MRLCCTLILIITGWAFAQDIHIQNGSEFKVGRSEEIINLMDHEKNRTSILTNIGGAKGIYYVLNLDAQLNEFSRQEIPSPTIGGKRVNFFWGNKLGEKIHYMCSFFNKDEDTWYLYASDLIPTTGVIENHKEVLRVKDDDFSRFNEPFAAYRSIDTSKLLIITEYPTGSNEYPKYGLVVFDENLDPVWSKILEFTTMDKNFELWDVDVDKKGNVHFTTRIRMGYQSWVSSNVDSRFYTSIYSYYHQDDVLKKYDLGFTSYYMSDINLELNAKDELIGTGFYAERGFQNGFDGYFYLKIDPQIRDIKTHYASNFSNEVLIEMIGESRFDRGRRFPPLKIRSAIHKPDGSSIIVAEHYEYTFSNNSSSTVTVGMTVSSSSETWRYGNVLVMYLDPDGQLTSAAVLKKNQFCTANNGAASMWQQMGIGANPGVNEKPYYGIAVLEHENLIYLVYNDNPKNEERLAAGKSPKSVRQNNAVTKLLIISPDGVVSENVLFKAKDKEEGRLMPLMPASFVQYNHNSMIMFGLKGKQMRATKLVIK